MRNSVLKEALQLGSAVVEGVRIEGVLAPGEFYHKRSD